MYEAQKLNANIYYICVGPWKSDKIANSLAGLLFFKFVTEPKSPRSIKARAL